MKIVIDIKKELYKAIMTRFINVPMAFAVIDAVKKGTVLEEKDGDDNGE